MNLCLSCLGWSHPSHTIPGTHGLSPVSVNWKSISQDTFRLSKQVKTSVQIPTAFWYSAVSCDPQKSQGGGKTIFLLPFYFAKSKTGDTN